MNKVYFRLIRLIMAAGLTFSLAGCTAQNNSAQDKALNFGERTDEKDSSLNDGQTDNTEPGIIDKNFDENSSTDNSSTDSQIPSVFYLEIEGTDVKTTGKFENDQRPGGGQPMLALDDEPNSALLQTQIGSIIDLTYNGDKFQYVVYESTGCKENLISDISGIPLVEENTGEELFQIHSSPDENGQVWLVRARKQ